MAQHDDREAQAQKRRQESLQQAADLQINSAIAHNLQSREGRRFLWWLLQVGKVHLQPFTSNALTTAFNCGELNVGNTILSRITQVHPAGFLQMQEENLNEHNERVRNASSTDARPERGGDSPGGYDTGADSGPDSVD